MAEKLKSMPARTTRGTPWTTLLLTTLATTAFFRTEASRQLTFERGLVLRATGPGRGLAAVATRNGWSDWPVVTVYSAEGLPLSPWLRSVSEQ